MFYLHTYSEKDGFKAEPCEEVPQAELNHIVSVQGYKYAMYCVNEDMQTFSTHCIAASQGEQITLLEVYTEAKIALQEARNRYDQLVWRKKNDEQWAEIKKEYGEKPWEYKKGGKKDGTINI